MRTLVCAALGIVLTAVRAMADPPEIQPIPDWEIEEDSFLSVNVVVTDPDSPELVYWVEVEDSHLFVTFDEENMQIHVHPMIHWNGATVVTMGVDDGDGGRTVDTEAFEVVVTPLNDCPVLLNSTPQPPVVMNEDECATITETQLRSLFRDPDWQWEGDTLSFINLSFNAGTVEPVPGGWMLCPPPNFSGSGRLDFQATDGECARSGMVNISVLPVNDCPVQDAPWSGQSGTEDEPLVAAGLATAWSDVEGSALSIGISGGTPGFSSSWNAATGELTITPPADFCGPAQLELAVSDGSCAVTAALDLDLTPVNDPPVLAALSAVEFDEDGDVAAAYAVTDVDGPALAVTVTSDTPEVAGSWSAGELQVTAAADWHGAAQLTVRACDGFTPEACVEAQVAVTVHPVNDGPQVGPVADVSFAEDGQLAVPVPMGDLDSPELAVTAVSDQASLAAVWEEALGAVVLTPAADWHGSANITVTVDDQAGRAVASTGFAAVVTPVNDAPVLAALSAVEFDEDGGVAVAYAVTDVDGPALAVTVTSDTPEVAGSWSAGELQVTAAADWHGAAQLTVRACDGFTPEACVEAPVAVTVHPVNDGPQVGPVADVSFPEDGQLAVPVPMGDLDSPELAVTAVSDQASLAAVWEEALGAVVLTPAADWHGSATITVTVDDQAGRTVASTGFTAVVTPVNDAPVLPVLAAQEILEDQVLTLSCPVADVDGPALTVTAASDTSALSAAWLPAGGELVLTPAPDWSGAAVVTVRACDGFDGPEACVEIQIPVTVLPVDDPPSVEAIADLAFPEDSTVQVPVVVHDVEDDDVTVSVSSDQPHLSAAVDAETGLLLLTPAADWHGAAGIKVSLEDEGGATLFSLRFTATVTPVNDAPQLPDLAELTVAEDGVLIVDYPIGDVDGPSLTVTAAADTAAVTAVWLPGNATLRVMAWADWHGQTVLTVTACDGAAEEACATAAIQVTVGAVNDAPEIAPIADQRIPEDSSVLVPVAISDLDNEELTVSAVSSRAELAIAWLPEAGGLRLEPTPDWYGAAQVTISVDDGEGRTVTQRAFAVLVQPVNDLPYADPCGTWTCGPVEDPRAFRTLVLNGGLLLDVADVDGDPLTLTWFVDGSAVAQHVFSAGADTLECWSLPAPPAELIDGNIVLHAELSDGTAVLNPGGEGCAWELDFNSLDGLVPGALSLGPAHPNPFNPATRLPFVLAQAGEMRLAVYDLRGAQVEVLAEGWHAAGPHEAVWRAGDRASGVYLAVLEADGRRLVSRLTLVK